MKRFWFVAFGALLIFTLFTGAQAQKPLKVALVLPGSASDAGFNQSAFESLTILKQKFKAETAFSENTPVANFAEVYRDFANKGFDIIIGHGFEFGPVAKKVAPEFPKVKFLVTSGFPEGPNTVGLVPRSSDAAYLAGVVAGMMTKSNKVGGVAGYKFPVIVGQMEGLKMGAKAVNPKADVTIIYIGSFEEVAKAKEAALAQISAGIDVIYHIADAAGVGVIKAAEEKNVKAIGWGKDQNYLAPKAVVVSQIVDYSKMIELQVKDIIEGKFKAGIRFFGLDTGAIGLSEYYGPVPKEVRDRVEAVKKDILDGKIKVPLTAEPPK